MTITQLKYCIAVAEHRNFTTAAEHAFVTQPTLSMQIQKLEKELDLTIFDRTQKPIALTAVGKKIIEQAKLIVSESERMLDVVDQEKGVIGGTFKLGIIPTIMPTLLKASMSSRGEPASKFSLASRVKYCCAETNVLDTSSTVNRMFFIAINY